MRKKSDVKTSLFLRISTLTFRSGGLLLNEVKHASLPIFFSFVAAILEMHR